MPAAEAASQIGHGDAGGYGGGWLPSLVPCHHSRPRGLISRARSWTRLARIQPGGASVQAAGGALRDEIAAVGASSSSS
jgi:hypothetical protein